MTVKEMVAKFLADNGYDGLYSDVDCACENGDLAPCGEMRDTCRAGYKANCTDACEHERAGLADDWHIQKEKP